MKIAVSSSGDGLDAEVSLVFGRCDYFAIVDTETMAATCLANPAVGAAGGAGVQSAQYVLQQGVEAVIGNNVGPNPMQVFGAAGVPVYSVTGGTVRRAVEALLSGALQPLNSSTVSKDFGKSGIAAQYTRRGAGLGGGARGGRGGFGQRG